MPCRNSSCSAHLAPSSRAAEPRELAPQEHGGRVHALRNRTAWLTFSAAAGMLCEMAFIVFFRIGVERISLADAFAIDRPSA